MFKKVLFCIPPFPNRYGLPTHPHTGVGYLSESLNDNGIETAVVDLRLGVGYKGLRNKIKEFSPDMFGVTMMTYYHNLAYEVVKFLRQYDIPIAIGGPHVSTLKEQALAESSGDFGFSMEAERSLVNFCKGEPPESIPGVIYRKNGKILQNAPSVIQDLDNIAFPKYKDFDLPSYARKRIPIISSRGCPCQCTFCPIVTVMGRRYRLRSAKNVFAELEYWYQHGYRDFDFQDDNFTLNKNRVYQICDMINLAGFDDLFMQCGNGIRADLVTRELLEKMKRAGFKAIAIGVESANQEILEKIKKGETIEQIESAVKVALEAGIEVSLFFIVGLPGETAKTFKNSIDFALRYSVTAATFYNLIPFPGTELFEWVKNNGYFIIQPKDYLNTIAHLECVPVFATPEFTALERKKALILSSKVNNKIKRKDMEKKLGNSPLSRISSWLLYETPLNGFIFALVKIQWLKKFINYILLKRRLRLNL